MKTRLGIFLLAMMAFIQPVAVPLAAADSGAAAGQTTSVQAQPNLLQASHGLEACPAERAGLTNLSAVSQTDCCKEHKGVCGCRAGKIVCCDKTVSPDCTCHSDWNLAN